MVDLRDSLANQQSGLEALAGKIPGYKGYKEKELRREADQKLREQLAAQLAGQLSQAEDIASQMLTGPGLSQLAEMGRGNTRLQTLIDKVKTAAQGYAGFFDAVKIKENELDLLYEFDDKMVNQVTEIEAALTSIQSALDSGDGSQLGPAVRGYVKAVAEVSAAFDRRKETILGLV